MQTAIRYDEDPLQTGQVRLDRVPEALPKTFQRPSGRSAREKPSSLG